jgi:hypothetical protein
MIMIKNSFEEEKINEYAKNTNKISDLVDVKINL